MFVLNDSGQFLYQCMYLITTIMLTPVPYDIFVAAISESKFEFMCIKSSIGVIKGVGSVGAPLMYIMHGKLALAAFRGQFHLMCICIPCCCMNGLEPMVGW